ncbi:MAG: hypothetical protein ACKVRO_15585 [Micropepsaceae bacterium]
MSTDFELLSDAGGAIRQVAIRLRGEWMTEPVERLAYESLLTSLRNTDVVIVTAQSTRDQLTEWLSTLNVPRHRIIDVPDDQFDDSHAWPRDTLLSAKAKGNGAPVHVHPIVSRMGELGSWLTTGLSATKRVAPVSLDGGDSLVVDKTRWLVGAGAVAATMKQGGGPRRSWDDAVTDIETAIGRKPIVAGFRYEDVEEPLRAMRLRMRGANAAHAPQNAGTAGRFMSRFFGDAKAARRLFDELAAEKLHTDWLHLDMVASLTGTERDGKPLILVADTMAPECPPDPEAEGRNLFLCALELELGRQGFSIKRIPAPCVGAFVLPYTNTILQTNPNEVWLPAFTAPGHDHRQTDAANARIWTDLGFAVHQLNGWRAFLESEGSIRCATLALQRN